MESPRLGQRWISLSEPELGLGAVREISAQAVRLEFPAVQATRQYALTSAPLRRVLFASGETLKTRQGDTLRVERVTREGDLHCYHGEGRYVMETELADDLSFSTPEARWWAGLLDETGLFSLRLEAWYRRSQMRQSPARGLVGGRVDLIPHQLRVATTVADRQLPRALLADEVGLGKTVEAGLILHRLHLTGRAERVLILVPEPLVHQWFVEMLRKFNLSFSLFDEARCEETESSDDGQNPFLESPLILADLTLLTSSPQRLQQAVEAGWDLLIVDEAHHLAWEDGEAGTAYRAVEALAAATPGLLLLTATPQQLGEGGHFARLRLLDPERYADLGKFQLEMERYAVVAQVVTRLQAGQWLTAKQSELFSRESPRIQRLVESGETAREELAAALLDGFGLGRVIFRHTRTQLTGFPPRQVHLVPLETSLEAEGIDLKITWLAALLRRLGEAKVLLIGHSQALAVEILAKLQAVVRVEATVFHEGLSLVQRDRAAAYFTDPEGARLLLCSEIGSEGRNFQFAHHLVLFDLPAAPELLEQRIGRLDRIGQRVKIHLHVPYLAGTSEEVWARWYHEGLDAFEHTLPGAERLARALDPASVPLADLAPFLQHTRQLRQELSTTLAQGQDRLLVLNSGGADAAAALIPQLHMLDADGHFEAFFLRVLEHFGMNIEPLGPRTYVLHPGHLQTAAFPAMPADGLTVTFDRTQALSREDWGFLTWDHPMVRGALDLLLTSESGNATLAIAPYSETEGLVLEAIYVAECLAPASLQVDRFLAPRPLRIVVDQSLADLSKDRALIQAKLNDVDPLKARSLAASIAPLLPPLLTQARVLAEAQAQRLTRSALRKMHHHYAHEIARHQNLTQAPEPTALATEQQSLHQALSEIRLRLDAFRVIWIS